MVRRCTGSRNIKNEEAVARVRPQHHRSIRSTATQIHTLLIKSRKFCSVIQSINFSWIQHCKSALASSHVAGGVPRSFIVVYRSNMMPQLPLCCILPTIITYAIYEILCSSISSSQVGLLACQRPTTARTYHQNWQFC